MLTDIKVCICSKIENASLFLESVFFLWAPCTKNFMKGAPDWQILLLNPCDIFSGKGASVKKIYSSSRSDRMLLIVNMTTGFVSCLMGIGTLLETAMNKKLLFRNSLQET